MLAPVTQLSAHVHAACVLHLGAPPELRIVGEQPGRGLEPSLQLEDPVPSSSVAPLGSPENVLRSRGLAVKAPRQTGLGRLALRRSPLGP
eukprot:5809276-Alexandrium_andersonii.AAC.1